MFDAGDRLVDVLVNMQSPRVVVFGNLLSHEECDALIADAEPRLDALKDADATDSTRVSIALRQLKYDWYKGPQFYRKCDHQSVQSVVIVESKSKGMKDKNDVFNVLAIEDADEKNLRSCEEMGHKVT